MEFRRHIKSEQRIQNLNELNAEIYLQVKLCESVGTTIETRHFKTGITDLIIF